MGRATLRSAWRLAIRVTAAGGALVMAASVAVGLPFAVEAQARTSHGRCAERFPKVIRDGFPEPAMRFSLRGQLRTTLHMSTGPVQIAGGRYTTETYDGTFPGPTLVICPGDKATVRVVNDLGTKEPTNLHVHGLHVSPRGDADNVFTEIPPAASQTYRYRIPLDHDPGAFWYHPHLHGYVAPQIFAGLSGAIVVEGGLDNLLARIPQRLMMIQSTELCGRNRRSVPFALSSPQRTSGSEPCDFPGRAIPDALTNERFTPLFVNGTLNPSVKIRQGQLQRWRIFNANNNRIVRLSLSKQPMWVLAEDGNTLPRMQRVRTLMIGPGSRREVLVRGSRRGTHTLTALPFAQFPTGDKPNLTSKNGGPTPDQTVLTLRASGPAANDRLPRGPLAHPVDLRRARVDRHRTIVFSETPNPAGGTLFGVNGDVFDHHMTPITMKLGSLEEWRVENTSSEWHTLHIHQNPFQVVRVDGRRPTDVTYEDNVAMPPCHVESHPADPSDPHCVRPSVVVIRMRPTDFTGRFVLHCHVTNHEDRGMMMAMQVLRRPTRRQLAGSVVQSPGMRIESASSGGRPVSARAAGEVPFLCHLDTPSRPGRRDWGAARRWFPERPAKDLHPIPRV
jgi:FtsP/CotA-like multicopper oxidase with cupredoxin domain